MRVFLIVLLVLTGLIVILCMTAASVHVRFWDGKFTWSVHYCGIRILPRPRKPDKEKDSSRISAPAKAKKKWKEKNEQYVEAVPLQQEAADSDISPPETDSVPDPEKGSTVLPTDERDEQEETKKDGCCLMDKLWKTMQEFVGKADMAGSAFYALSAPLKRLFRGITWYAIETDILIGGEDAAATALLYGGVQSLLHQLLAESGNFMRVKRKQLAIVCDFTEDTCRWNASCRFRIRIGTVLAVGIGLLWRYFMDSITAGRDTSGKKL